MKKAKLIGLIGVAFLLTGCGKSTASTSDDTQGTDTTITSLVEEKSEILSFAVNPSYKAYKNSVVLDDVGDLKADGGDATKYPHNGFFKNKEGGKDSYKVGSANAFQVHCYGSYLDGGFNLVNEEIEDVTHKLEIKKEDGSYLDVTSEESTYVEVVGSNYDFTNAAIGRSFKLTLTPDATKYEAGSYSDVLEFDVIDAWNVYTPKDLAYLDNFDPESPLIPSQDRGRYIVDAWADERDTKVANTINGIVFQNDITLTSEDIPSVLKWDDKQIEDYIKANTNDFQTWAKNKFKTYEENGSTKDRTDNECYEMGKDLLRGSLRDFVNVYSRIVEHDKTFNIEGNYFTLDISGVKKVVKFRDKDLVNSASSNGSHSNLFGFPGDSGLGNADGQGVLSPYQLNLFNGEMSMANLNIKGNAPMADDTANLGGLICIKVSSKKFTATNINSSDTFITFFPRVDNTEKISGSTVIDRCRWYNSYSSMLFMYSSTDNKISNSIMSGAGGALMILAEPYSAGHKNDERHLGSTAEISNSFLEAYVNGQESWFVDKNATSYVQMLTQFQTKILNTIKADYSGTSSFVKEINGSKYINLISLHLDSDDTFENYLSTGSALKGKLKIDDEQVMDFAELTSPIGSLYPLSATLAAMGQQGLLFKSSAGGIAAAGSIDGSEMLTYSNSFAGLDNTYRSAVINQFSAQSALLGQLASANIFPASQHALITGGLRGAGVTNVADEMDQTLTKLVSGEYLSIMMQASVDTHYIGLVLGYTA